MRGSWLLVGFFSRNILRSRNSFALGSKILILFNFLNSNLCMFIYALNRAWCRKVLVLNKNSILILVRNEYNVSGLLRWLFLYLEVCSCKKQLLNVLVHLTKQKAAHEICSLLFSLVLSTFSLPLLHADVHVDTTTMSLENTIQCTILGFYCSQCKTAMNKDSVRKHLQRNHLELIESMSKSDLREFLTTTADAVKSTSIESCLVGPIKRGLACSTCHTICSTKSVFTRHSTAGKCVGGKLIHISFRDTTCFRQHIINQP